MEFSSVFETTSNANKVCRLQKSLYGLKQSSRAWFERFSRAIKKHGHSQGQSDHILFTKHSHDGKVAILIVYVDGIILTRSYEEEMIKLKEILDKEFEIKDLKAIRYCLGREAARSRKGIYIS